MNLLKDDIRRLFYYFLVPAISSAIAVATYSLIDTIAIGQGVGPDGTAACSLAYQEGTGKSGSYGMWNHPRGHVWNVFVRPASS